MKNKSGDQLERPESLKTIQRFLAKVKMNGRSGKGHSGEETPCWNWQGCLQRNGYGRFGFAGRTHLAHRVAYAIFNEKTPVGLHVHHLCSNTHCVNPEHLAAVSPADNCSEAALRRHNGFPEFDPTKKEETPF